jgi:hypothetical protein
MADGLTEKTLTEPRWLTSDEVPNCECTSWSDLVLTVPVRTAVRTNRPETVATAGLSRFLTVSSSGALSQLMASIGPYRSLRVNRS